MADFKTAYQITGVFEGGYANDPKDKGGETYAGISRNNFPKWDGWRVLDAYKNKPDFQKALSESTILPNMIQAFYYSNFWNAIRGNEIENQHIANMIYDMAVNSGVSTAIKLAQRTAAIPVTGEMNQLTLDKINNKS